MTYQPNQQDDIPDEAFLDALAFDYRKAPTIARHMIEAGTMATLKTIRQRMKEFTSHTSEIEADGHAWRIKPLNDNVPVDEPANDNISPRSNDNQSVALPTKVMEPLLVNGCGLELLRQLLDKSIHLALLDLPYGTTRSKFDPVIDVDAHMKELRRIVTDTGAIVCFSSQPFTTQLINAAPDLFKQELVWEKDRATGHQQSHARHLKAHESILIFSKGTVISPCRSSRAMTYNPQNITRTMKTKTGKVGSEYLGNVQKGHSGKPHESWSDCPRSVLYFPKDKEHLHSYQKPVALLEYLIRTFSNAGETVLDHTMGSGSTCVAAIRTGRTFIGAENGFKKNGASIFDIAEKRIAAELAGQDNPPPEPSDDNPVPTPPKPANDNISPKASDLQTVALPTKVFEPLLVNGCGLELLRKLPDKSVHLCLLDLPYGVTNKPFDPSIDVDAHMKELRRIVTDRGAIVCFATQPFATKLINAAPDLLKDELIWEKDGATGWLDSESRHLKAHENILVFSKGTKASPKCSKRTMTFNPQVNVHAKSSGKRHPRSVLYFPKDKKRLHSFQKPIDLLQYLIRTFSNDNDVVLDHTMGSGSTCVAAIRTGRCFVGAENGFLKDGASIFDMAAKRIAEEITGEDNHQPGSFGNDPTPTPPRPRGGKSKKPRKWSAAQRAKHAATIARKASGLSR